MSSQPKLNKTQRAVLQAIRNDPGVRFGLGTRQAASARSLRKLGFVWWKWHRRDGGWYPTVKAEDERCTY